LNPSIEKLTNILEGLDFQRKVILIIGNCWVHYHGRASSKLESREHILIIKKDGSLLHRSVDYEPVNRARNCHGYESSDWHTSSCHPHNTYTSMMGDIFRKPYQKC